jgi:hypothetical protein
MLTAREKERLCRAGGWLPKADVDVVKPDDIGGEYEVEFTSSDLSFGR